MFQTKYWGRSCGIRSVNQNADIEYVRIFMLFLSIILSKLNRLFVCFVMQMLFEIYSQNVHRTVRPNWMMSLLSIWLCVAMCRWNKRPLVHRKLRAHSICSEYESCHCWWNCFFKILSSFFSFSNHSWAPEFGTVLNKRSAGWPPYRLESVRLVKICTWPSQRPSMR